MPENLWPEFPMEPKPRTIRSVLLEAGAGIAERTGNRLGFDVTTSQEERRRFLYTCYLTSKTGLRFPLFMVVEHGDPYPLTVYSEEGAGRGVKVKSEEDLLQHLRSLFAGDPVKRTVYQLIEAVA